MKLYDNYFDEFINNMTDEFYYSADTQKKLDNNDKKNWGLAEEKLSIHSLSTIGMNSCVIKHIEEPGIYVGVPAKKIK